MSKESKYITRRVVEGCKYNVYTWGKNGEPKLLDTVEIKGRINKKELGDKYKVESKNIFTKQIDVIRKKYVMTVDDFMKYAVDLDSLSKEEQEVANEGSEE